LETIEELTALIEKLTPEGVRGRLQDRGEARALIRVDGELPDDAPPFGDSLDSELAEYGLSLLRAAFALREQGGHLLVSRKGFTKAARAFEAIVQNGNPKDRNRGFFRVCGAAAYHLASYSAQAYSLAFQSQPNANFSPAEEAIVYLILRNLANLRERSRDWLLQDAHSDRRLAELIEAGETKSDDVIEVVITSAVFRAYLYFDFALQTGSERLVEISRDLLAKGLLLARDAGSVTLWWTVRIASNLLDDLWGNALHRVLPIEGPQDSINYTNLRRLFISVLYSREVSEVELWPSQLEAAQRATNVTDSLVVALPTSAGKTRIAEIAAFCALSCGRRVVIVTPLRALSAQTERSFRRTFSALGFSVSSLYGASGAPAGDEDALRSSHIVIATPEKLDFALRNDRSIIDDVGLIVLDEGHLIGPNEREIRYESLVQRLLRRTDAAARRIVCLSAILPEGDQLQDLTAWIRRDAPGNPIKSNWRPTRQRFGTLSWQGNSARLAFDLEAGGPFIRHFIQQQPGLGRRRAPFPRDNKELTLAAAWKFHGQGKRTLIFCTQRDRVEGIASTIVDLYERGYLQTLIDDQQPIGRALAIGSEWLGDEHPAVKCLSLGVAIHHGRLPAPFLREIESLLAANVLRVTVASPTLAQGLNLNAAVLLIPSLYRGSNLLSGEEFANVAGRAGRAFVDLEGLILNVTYDDQHWRAAVWRDLVRSAKARSLQSGMITIIATIIDRLSRGGVLARKDVTEYLANSVQAWFPADEPDDPETVESLIEKLDVTVFGLIDALDSVTSDLPRLIDEALQGSLWSRQIARLNPQDINNQRWLLQTRANLIWNRSDGAQRRSIFAMGVGFDSGLAIDEVADELTVQLDLADGAALGGDLDQLCFSLTHIAQRLFKIRPFIPEVIVPFWPAVLRDWLAGVPVADLGSEKLRFIEDAFVYRLTWALEALRMRRRAVGVESELLDGAAAAVVETGVPRTMMAMLIRNGLPSRAAAIAAIEDTDPVFATPQGMREWLAEEAISGLSELPDWPTPDTAQIWRDFRLNALAKQNERWTQQHWDIELHQVRHIEPGIPYRVHADRATGKVTVTSPDYQEVYSIEHRLENPHPGILQVTFSPDGRHSRIERLGRSEARWLRAAD
jgi:hypothetical protein